MDILDKVKSLGLNSYEAKVYLSLYERESLSVSEISKLSGVPRARVYDTLDSLVVEGLATLKPGRHKKYSASDPEVLQGKLERKIEEQYSEQKETLSSTVLTLKRKYEATHEDGIDNTNPLEYIEVLKNPLHIHRKYLELYSKAQHEVLSFTKPPFAFTTDKQMEEQFKVQYDAVDRKVKIRAIIEFSPKDEIEELFSKLFNENKMMKVPANRQEVRIIDDLPIKMFVFDGRTCFFTLEDPIKGKTSLTMLVTDHVAMAKSFKLLFESFWEKSRYYYTIKGKKHYIYSQEEIKRRKGGKD